MLLLIATGEGGGGGGVSLGMCAEMITPTFVP